MFEKSIKFFCIFLILNFCSITCANDKTPCQGCNALVDGLFQGLDTTARKNFGGGDVDWEEKRNLKYKTSELRLVEVIETACSKDGFQCHRILEEHEENIEHWYFKLQDDPTVTLHEYLCINKAKVCCPNDTYGEQCVGCPRGNSTEICYGHGTCEGSGDRQGSGKCDCSTGYKGKLCNECSAKYYESFSNETSVNCSSCHFTCHDCKGPGPNDCRTCGTGFKREVDEENEDLIKCVDINECEKTPNICAAGKYCSNTWGSYSCLDCNAVCKTCKGSSENDCTSCVTGYEKETEEDTDVFQCVDINECVGQPGICPESQFCANTAGSYECEDLKNETQEETSNEDELNDEMSNEEEKDEL